MIKKNTKVIFESGNTKREEELIGGIPLSKGETTNMHEKNSKKIIKYEVVEKKVDCFWQGEDQIIDIVYALRKK